MASNSFGTIFKITTWGESHGKAIGVVIDGCPAGLEISEEEIRSLLALRSPGRNQYVSPRKEEDKAEILSGVFEGKTTGAPIMIMIPNRDADSSKYESTKDLLRPGHANFTYMEKYGVFDYRGGGRASGRETASRVAAGALAKKLLSHYGIEVIAYIKEIGGIHALDIGSLTSEELRKRSQESPVFCPDARASLEMMQLIEGIKKEGDSVGGVVELIAFSLPVGLGDPVYEKLQANLAKAILSIPATKAIEFGEGFYASSMRGSKHNDSFCLGEGGKVVTKTNHAGGMLGGISTGMPLVLRVAFKPPSGIMKTQETVTLSKEKAEFSLAEGSRHDPCLAIRGTPVVEAMASFVLIDAILMNRAARL